jgi:hypothetical protein
MRPIWMLPPDSRNPSMCGQGDDGWNSPIMRRVGFPDRAHQMLGRPRCLTFGAKRVDIAVGRELLLAVAPLAIEAA